ncbi:restriction endonuclease subunit S [Deinococcus radiomollis]|uniref:restriction endonuclease subunit S n=1 Tax=Deinococcus radiomollis TaxID=468916 RepID=UPI003891F675
MIHDLKPYPAMKDSGVPWLGHVPEHWEVRSLGSLTRARSERGRADLPLLSVVREKGVILRDLENSEGNHNFIPDDLSNYKVVREGNLVVNKMKAWQGSMGLAPLAGIVSPAYFVFDFDIQNRLFGQALLRSKPYVGFFARASDGVRIGQWDLSIDGMKRIPVVIPSPAEQAAIVRFLDHPDRRIRRTIAAKQRLIKLLQEQKQVIIHQAVTRGLDPDVKLKPSGVEWLGDVPEGWEITKLGRVVQLTTGFPFKSEGFSQSEEDIRLLRGINVNPGNIRWEEFVRWPAPERYKYSSFELAQDDLVIGMDRPIVSNGVRAAAITANDLPSLLVQRVARLRASSSLVVKFALYVLQGKGFSDYLTPIFTGISVPHLSPEQIKSFIFAVPTVAEQQRILSFIDKETDIANQAISRAHIEIALLREYRTRLIADVVTGKLDVREAVAGLPELDAEPLSDDLELEDGELEGEEAEAEADASEVVEA